MFSTSQVHHTTPSIPEPYQTVPAVRDPASIRDYTDLVGHMVRIVPNVIGTPHSSLVFVRTVEQLGGAEIIFGRFVVPIQDRAILPRELFPGGLDGYALAGDFRMRVEAVSHLEGIDSSNDCRLYDPLEISRYVDEWLDARENAPVTLRSGCGTLIAGGLLALGSAVTGLVLSAAKLPPPPPHADEPGQTAIELVKR